MRQSIFLGKRPVSARLYVTGCGLYECMVNGNLANDGYLQPGFCNYNLWQQYQSLDVTELLGQGPNVLSFLLGDGWYRGRFGVAGGHWNNFGERLHLLYELVVTYGDGTEESFGSGKGLRYAPGPIKTSSIYDGEEYDASALDNRWTQPGFNDSAWGDVVLGEPKKCGTLTERLSIPVVPKEKRKPVRLFTDADGRKVLDVGQNVTGWLVFEDMLDAGMTIVCRFAEHMEDGRLCRKNLLTAKQEFCYTSNGEGMLVRPHFTYFGFRYVEISGFPETVSAEDFTVWVMYSDMSETLWLETGHGKLNRLLSNVLWSQRDNFLEHPSDCPQRAERLGWTGDAQMYCGTASFFMQTAAFYRKYMKDVREEQLQKNGMVPFIIPKIEAGDDFQGVRNEEECSAAWSDVATIIPWTLYVFYGDRALLKEQYGGMKAWTDFIQRKDEAAGGKGLWQDGFHFGDWLALDNPEPGPFGLTDPLYIASCYYYYSASLTAKAAGILGYGEDEKHYSWLTEKIRAAIREAYFDGRGICRLDTQTAYVLAIFLELVDNEAQKRNGDKLAEKIRGNGNHLDTGFVGTPYLCFALSKTGHVEEAYDLLLQEAYPSWLYEVNQGATTIWEAWDALGQDGKLTGEMSLNHYTFGSIAEWVIKEAAGLKPLEVGPGFRKVEISPKPDRRLGHLDLHYQSPCGEYRIFWEYQKEGLNVSITVPTGAEAQIIFEDFGIKRKLSGGTDTFIVSN